MSCRSTRAGTASLRLVRRETGLTDREATSLFHALKREGVNCEPPTLSQFREWQNNLKQSLEASDTTAHQRARTEQDLAAIEDEDYEGPTFYALAMIEKRARQEKALQEIRQTAASMSEPGSESHLYELDENGVPKQVWYASYGSNINSERFHTYLTGDKYRGQAANSGGARDATLPDEEIGVMLPGRLLFASRSGRWGGGGIAFIDPDDQYSYSAGKAYSVSWSQFEDVLAQESGGSAGTKKVEWKELQENKDMDVGGLYGRILHVGDYNGKPVITFTGNYDAQELAHDIQNSPGSTFRTANKPHGNYIRTIGEGLKDTFGTDTATQADYFAGSLGGHYLTADETVKILESDYEAIAPTRPKSSSYSRPSLRDRVKYEPLSNSSRRNYTPWWEDPEDPINRKAQSRQAARDDEIPDWWWDANSEDELYGDDYPLFDDVQDFDEDITPFATPKKRCVICQEQSHDMHSCPWL
jgi:hypothetical protein